MVFLIILLFAWVIQSQDIQNGNIQIQGDAFELQVTINDPKHNIYPVPCKSRTEDCSGYKHRLCNLLLSAYLRDLKPPDIRSIHKLCYAQQLTDLTDDRMDWYIKLSILITSPEGPLINFTCPTFSHLLIYILTIELPTSTLKGTTIKVNSYEPKPNPFDPSKVKDATFIVNGYLCDENHRPIPESMSSKYDENFTITALRNMDKASEMGHLLLSNGEINQTSFMKNVTGGKIFVTYDLMYSGSLFNLWKIDPYCDTANLLKFAYNESFSEKDDVALCGARIQGPPPPPPPTTTEVPVTSKPVSVTTTAYACTTTISMKTLVYALVLSQIAGII